MNRIKKVKFSNLTSKEYKNIIINHFNIIRNYWKDSKNSGITLEINDKIIEDLSKRVEIINKGARPIDLWIMPNIQTIIVEQIKSSPNYNFLQGKTFNVIYDKTNNLFSLN